ncbi:hypothetical protein DQ04_06311020 [Trypanosoma grayi]|uniref:hypothetical protein n=1 Tax=Trypanosoma grayi TaxID=71804 RepID=UPI0004F45A35|nr:hypothetical protein DQ04_06311020 [Trypanosoma grayi]KEG08853.1 hypothetical protein DQ04_06311020 [Trypanosoma grayi]
MPQDKRLIVTKAVVHKLQRLCGGEAAAAESGIYIEFIVPTVVVAQCPDLLGTHIFQLPKRTYPMNGRTTCLIVPRLISGDAMKINKRHGYYDAVVTAEAICKRDDTEAARRAAQVAKTFSHFVVDARIVSKLPQCILAAAAAARPVPSPSPGPASAQGDRKGSASRKAALKSNGAKSGDAAAASATTTPAAAQGLSVIKASRHCITALHGLDDRTSLTFRLSQGATGGVLRARQQGQLMFRVGHGGMTAGDVCENAKNFVFALKKDFPTVWKYIHEFKMTSDATEPIRFMEVHIQK